MTAAATSDPDPQRLRRERDLYRGLLALDACDDLEPLLHEALSLLVAVTGAHQGYLSVRPSPDGGSARFTSQSCTEADLDDIRGRISSGIVAEALATGRTVSTASAWEDPRFQASRSVQANRIRAVLCAPVGGERGLGVVYLQGRDRPGPFAEGDRADTETFARHLGPLVERLVLRSALDLAADPTAPYRARLRLPGLVGRSPALAEVLRAVSLVAPLEVGVLLTGPSGSGKTDLALAIHANSPRAARPFVALNCAALPVELMESELFGAVAGAHSTATRTLPGKVSAAEGGTLFLDEVGELPVPAQAKLLQLLQSRQYWRLGATRPESADVRVLAATNADLRERVASRQFREDLLYRLEVLPIRLPSLQERVEDVPLLLAHFVREASARHRLPGLALAPSALAAATATEWPGNVRQLAHAAEAGLIRAAGAGATAVTADHLFPGRVGPAAGSGGSDGSGVAAGTFQDATRSFQRRLVHAALQETGWNVSEAARRLDIARSHLNELIRGFGLRREDGEPRSP